MIEFQLVAFTPGSDSPTILPRPMSYEAGMVLSDVSALRITYPIGAPGDTLLSGKPTVDVEIRYRTTAGWVCPPQGRFLKMDSDFDPVVDAQQRTRTFTLPSYSWLVRRVFQRQDTGLDAQGNRPFPNMTRGQVVATLVSEARAAGYLPNMTLVNDVTSGVASPAYPFGKSALDILTESRDQGLCEWLMQPDGTGQGRQLHLYGTVGVDRSTGANPVQLRIGRDLLAAPSKVSNQDMAGEVLVSGDSGRTLKLSNPGADTSYGLMPDYVTAGGITDAAALQIVAQVRLDKGKGPRAQHTRQIIFRDSGPLPFVNYNLGDTVQGPDENGAMVPLRVRQITVTFDSQNGLSGNLVLGDKFTERDLLLAKKVAQLTGGASSISGAGRPPTPAADDKRLPSAPTGFNVGSTPYTDSRGIYRALADLGWVNPTTATDGSTMDPGSIEVGWRRGTTAQWARLTAVDFPATSVQWSPFDAGVVYQFRVRALSVNRLPGPWGPTVQVTMAKDSTPPPKPSKGGGESRLGTVIVRWDGLDYQGGPQPADYDHTDVHVSSDTGYVPSAATRVGVLWGAGSWVLTNLPYNQTRYVKLVSYDKAGNASEPSDALAVVSIPLVNIDIIGKIISGANIVPGTVNIADSMVANSITSAAIGALTIKAGNIDANAVTTDKLAAGAVTAVKVAANSISTDKLLVGVDIVTLAPSLASEPGAWALSNGVVIGVDAGADDGVNLTFTNAPAGKATGPRRPTKPGERWFARCGTWSQAWMVNPMVLRLYWHDATGTYLGLDTVATRTANLAGYQTLSGSAAAPAGAMFVTLGVERVGTGGTTACSVTNLAGWRQAGGTRIEDGAITTVKVAANSITADKISVGSLSAISANIGNITAGTITGATIQSGSGNSRVVINGNDFRLTDNNGDWLVRFSPGDGYIGIRSNTVDRHSIHITSQYGIQLFDAGGTRTMYLAAADGSIRMTGPLIAGGTITGATFQTATTGARTVLSPTALTFYGTDNVYRTLMDSSGNMVIRSASGGARFEIIASQGISLYNGSGARTVYLNAGNGDATFQGTVNASNINTSTINGGSLSGTGGSYGGRLDGTYGSVGGALYATGSGGVMRSSSGSSRVEMRGAALWLYNGGFVGGVLSASTSGVSISDTTTAFGLQNSGFWAPPIYDNTTTVTISNMWIDSGGIVHRTTSSVRNKLGVQTVTNARRVLAVDGSTWWDPRHPDHGMGVGFIAESMAAAGVEELVLRDEKGWPENVNYTGMHAFHHELIKDHDGRLANLERQVVAQAEQITALSARVDQLAAA